MKQGLLKFLLLKIPTASSKLSNDKIRLYSFSDLTPEGIAKVQLLFELEIQGKIYKGITSQMFQEIQTKPYLFKMGNHLKLISEKETFQLRIGYGYESLGEYNKAIEYYKKDLGFALDFHDKREEGRAYCNLGIAYQRLRESHKAMEYHEQHLKIALELKDKEEKGRAYGNLGIVYRELGKYSKAIEYHEKHLEIARELKDKLGQGRAYGDLGITYQKLNETHKAIEYHEQHLKVAVELKDKGEEGRAYGNLGIAYQELEKYNKAVEYHRKHLEIEQELRDRLGQGRAYGNLGIAYHCLGEESKAIEYHEKHLEITRGLKDRLGEGSAYANLGNVYQGLGEYSKAIEYHKKHLEIAQELKNQEEEGSAYGNLGNAYQELGKYHEAISYHENVLKIMLELKDQVGEGRAYSNLGNAYYRLGEYRKAISCHNQDLKIMIEMKYRMKEGKAYCNLGNAYQGLGKIRQAIIYHEEHLKIALEFKDQIEEGTAYGNLGNACYSLEKAPEAISYYKNALKIALELKDQVREGMAYGNLGVAYQKLGKHRKSIGYFNKDFNIKLRLEDQVGKGKAYCNLGSAHCKLSEYPEAEECFRKSIEFMASLQYDAKQAQWQITLFEELVKPYIGLEKLLLLQEKKVQALEISDARRSRALSFLLSQKLSSKENQDFSPNPLSLEKIQKLAEKLSTTFVVYSLTSLTIEKPPIQVWVISSKGEAAQSISLPIPEDIFSELDLIFKAFPYQAEIKRPTRGRNNSTQLFKERLSSWYDLLIAPLEQHLPAPDYGEMLTFIPDGFLAHLPFGAFYNTRTNRYLIESYPISVAPSMQVLSLLDQLPKELSSQTLLMGNPNTPQGEKDQLEHAEREVQDIVAPLLKLPQSEVFIQKAVTVENVFKYAPNAKVIHIACHGVAEKKPQDDPYSVFEGFFKLAPDIKHSGGELHAKEVNLLTLKADLVFMSACHLGRGNLQKEGSIGPIWSFLGAGAKSTIASYWPLPEGDMTVKMVDTFYRHYLGFDTPKLSKAKALQQAVLMAMQTERDKPRQWGAFFLAGLIE